MLTSITRESSLFSYEGAQCSHRERSAYCFHTRGLVALIGREALAVLMKKTLPIFAEKTLADFVEGALAVQKKNIQEQANIHSKFRSCNTIHGFESSISRASTHERKKPFIK